MCTIIVECKVTLFLIENKILWKKNDCHVIFQCSFVLTFSSFCPNFGVTDSCKIIYCEGLFLCLPLHLQIEKNDWFPYSFWIGRICSVLLRCETRQYFLTGMFHLNNNKNKTMNISINIGVWRYSISLYFSTKFQSNEKDR